MVKSMTDSCKYFIGEIEECDRVLSHAIEMVIFDDKKLKEYGILAKQRAACFTYELFEKNLCDIIEQDED